MKEEQSAIIEALKYAIQMELDGKKFYMLAGKDSYNRVGKELYSWLAAQEDRHRERFEEIYKSMAENRGWPAVDVSPVKGQKPGTLFAQAIEDLGTSVKAKKSEIEATKKAMEMEIKSKDFYRQQEDKSTAEAEKKFFNAIASEEQGHYLALVDYQEYISDPTGWFTRTEHHLLDGA